MKTNIKDQPDQNKNFMVLKLLSYVPEFKKDVSKIRTEMGIKEGGFEWNKDEMWKWASIKNIEYYQGLPQGDEEEGTGHIGVSSKRDDDVRKKFPSNSFEKKMSTLGKKYKLPFNFYAFPSEGLPRFILNGEIVPPRSNYYIDYYEAGDKSIWTSLVSYAPLSTKELREATNELKDINMDVLSELFKGVDILAKTRYRSKIQRDISLLEEQIKRSGKPKKVKRYEQSSYLDILNKSKSTSAKTKRIWERKNKGDVTVEYDNPTSKQIGKKQGVSADTTRQSKKRLNLLAKELFGYDLEL